MQKIKNPTITAKLTRPFSKNRRNAIIGAAAYSTTRILQAGSLLHLPSSGKTSPFAGMAMLSQGLRRDDIPLQHSTRLYD